MMQESRMTKQHTTIFAQSLLACHYELELKSPCSQHGSALWHTGNTGCTSIWQAYVMRHAPPPLGCGRLAAISALSHFARSMISSGPPCEKK
eukprot:6469467-Amphidinium_carterae.1